MGGSNSTENICDNIAPLASFDAEAYMGTWYVIQKSYGSRYDSDFFYRTRAEYSNLDKETSTFEIGNTAAIWPFNFEYTAPGTGIANEFG